MTTRLLYLEDFDVVSCEATVVAVVKTEDDRTDVVLDQTCFYPRGGGQDWDIGTIGDFKVQEVRLDEQGIVHHSGQGNVRVGDTVQCQVDTERRAINTRLHSAGHLLDMAINQLQPDWVPARGGHYPHMSFVEYTVPPDTQVDEDFSKTLAGCVHDCVHGPAGNYSNQVRFMSKHEMAQYCRHVPDNIPANKPSRIVLYADDFGIPCGGTHVRRVKDIGQITITKIKVKKGLAKVSYAVQGIN